jgi:hypothetical protein
MAEASMNRTPSGEKCARGRAAVSGQPLSVPDTLCFQVDHKVSEPDSLWFHAHMVKRVKSGAIKGQKVSQVTPD